MIKHTFYAFNAEMVLFDVNKNMIHALDVKRTVILAAKFSNKTYLNGCFELENGKGLLSLLNKDSLNISLLNQSAGCSTKGLAIHNVETNFDTNVYFVTDENKFTTKRLKLRPQANDYYAVFDVDSLFIKRMKLQRKLTDASLLRVINDDASVRFVFDLASSVDGEYEINELVKYEKCENFKFNSFSFKPILKVLGVEGEKRFHISKHGLVMISCKTKYLDYRYVIPAEAY